MLLLRRVWLMRVSLITSMMITMTSWSGVLSSMFSSIRVIVEWWRWVWGASWSTIMSSSMPSSMSSFAFTSSTPTRMISRSWSWFHGSSTSFISWSMSFLVWLMIMLTLWFRFSLLIQLLLWRYFLIYWGWFNLRFWFL